MRECDKKRIKVSEMRFLSRVILERSLATQQNRHTTERLKLIELKKTMEDIA
jgi:hypothetical protein